MLITTLLLCVAQPLSQAEFSDYPWTYPLVSEFGIGQTQAPTWNEEFEFHGQIMSTGIDSPLEGVNVVWNGRKYQTNAKGQFHFSVNESRAIPPLPRATIYAQGYEIKTFLPVAGFSSPEQAGIFHLERGANLSINLSRRGTPLENVLAYPVFSLGDVLPSSLSPQLHRTTNELGQLTISEIPASTFFQIYLREENGESVVLPGRYLIDPGQTSELDFDLAEIAAKAPVIANNNQHLAGTVLGSNGQPASGVLIFASWGENGQAITRSDEFGEFVLERLPAELVEVNAIQRGGTQVSHRVMAIPDPDTRLAITIPDTQSIKLKEAGTATASNKHGVVGRLHASQSGYTSNHNWKSGEELNFDLVPGEYSYYLSSNDGKVAFGKFDTKSNGHQSYHWLPARTVNFTAPGESGKVLLQFSYNGERVIEVKVSARERFRLRLPLGSINVTARHGGEFLASLNLTVSEAKGQSFKFNQ